MGERAEIRIGNYDFLGCKNSFGDLLSLFDPREFKSEEDSCDGELYTRRFFSKTVRQAKMCLDVMGHTLKSAKNLFERNIDELLFSISEDLNDEEYQTIDDDFTYDAWEQAVKKYAVVMAKDRYENQHFELLEQEQPSTIVEKIVYKSLPFDDNFSFFGINVSDIDYAAGEHWDVFRVILEAFDDEEKVILDYTNLFEGGWCEEFPDEDSFRVSKIVILTEGKEDARVIGSAMELLYPHMVKHFSFIDFNSYAVQGSTNYLTHYLKAFIAAGIENRIIALYDNDSAGLAEIKGLEKLKIPNNVKIMHLPDLDFCNNYPTIGLSDEKNVENINGRACSIEMFFGRDVLSTDGALIPIKWKSYMDKVKTFQGAIIDKTLVQKRFDNKLSRCKSDGYLAEEWADFDKLLNMLFYAFMDDERDI